MEKLDIFFRALQEYEKRTSAGLERQLNKIAQANPDSDRIEIVGYDCKIESDWIEAIEKGLPHIEKAIAEERQFIRSNGDVLPIEKVKQVSKESVEHLARHSNLLTRETENDITPDKLYTVERLTDYAVYENRFLYMLLRFLCDFVSYRYEKICELTDTYNGSLRIKKDVGAGNRRTAVEIKLDERISDDGYVAAHNPAKDEISRLDLILKTAAMLLSTPLMEDVSKSPMLKPPITETNVLKMNKHFKGAKELYYFLAAYDGDGFEVKRTVKTLSPFNGETAEDFAQVTALISFLTYAHGLNLTAELKENYAQILKEEEKENARKLKEKIKNLKKRIEQSGAGAEEYLLSLERLNRSLEADAAALIGARAELENKSAEIALLQESVRGLNDSMARHIEERNLSDMRHAEELRQISSEFGERLQAENARHEKELENIAAKYGEGLQSLKEQAQRELNLAAEKFALLQGEKGEAEKSLKSCAEELEKLRAEKLLTDAKYNALKKQCGRPSDGFTSEEKFDELEREYNALKALFKEEWKKTKKKIRRDVLRPGNKDNGKNKEDGEK